MICDLKRLLGMENSTPGSPSVNVNGANARVVVGLVGAGRWCDTNRGWTDLYAGVQAGLCRLGGVADVSTICRQSVKARFRAPDCPEYEDYRKLLEDRSLDAIVCSVEDHWHAPVILQALRAGKHVYVVPPLCRYLHEAFEIWDACKASGKVLQLGVQACSDQRWHKAAELVAQGRIGPLVMAQGSYMHNIPKGEWNNPIFEWATKEDVRWDLWKKEGVQTPDSISSEDFFRWEKYYRYSAGLLARPLVYRAPAYLLAMGQTSFPRRVVAMGAQAVQSDRNTPGARRREVPEFIRVDAEFPDGSMLCLTSSSVNEAGLPEVLCGYKASIWMRGSTVELKPQTAFVAEVTPERFGPFPFESVEAHVTNWIESIRGNQRPNCGIELAARTQVLLSMAEISDRLSVTCLFDPATRKTHDISGRELRLPA